MDNSTMVQFHHERQPGHERQQTFGYNSMQQQRKKSPSPEIVERHTGSPSKSGAAPPQIGKTNFHPIDD